MSKKHFIDLAECLQNTLRELQALQPHLTPTQADQAFETVLDNICIFCRRANSNFKESRFRDYIAGKCGPSGGTIKKAS